MRLTFNLRHILKKNLQLQGELDTAELELAGMDELVAIGPVVAYDLCVERLSQSVLVRGELRFELNCHCARCLQPFRNDVHLADWTCNLPLEGEDRVPVDNDSVDLTPLIREDILLAFPQHPLCRTECGGLLNAPQAKSQPVVRVKPSGEDLSAWAVLNKLKL